jgi:adenine-specific DNA-methyltransferase
MTENFNRLVTLLRELFQMDRPDLDFGIYRIMNQKRKDVSAFLENDLLPQVRQELSKVNSGGNVQAELDAAIKQLHELGVDPESSPKVKALREKLASTVNTTSLENEIYSHLYNFFRRYYKDGDFLSLRRYKKDVYAIPYEGEEVKLHWANADQYYIKSAENFRDYAFLVGEAPAEGQEDTRKRVHFKLVDADTEVANNKAQEGKERRFMLCDDTPMLEEDGELIIRFEYKPTAKKQNQKSLNEAAVKTILGNASFVGWVRLLAQEDNGRSCLEKHLNIYTARNTFDYFIHKDLGGFLRRELDFYIKNEVLFLDDIESQTAAHVEGQLTQIRVLRRIAHKIIRFLEQIENFQKKLWLKKKFVVETNYLITLDQIPEELYPEIAANGAQREEWIRLFAIDEIKKEMMKPGYSAPLTIEFLKENNKLVLDTIFFGKKFKAKILEHIDNIDSQCNGILLNSENFQALNLLKRKYTKKINCVYIDPPYNTGGDGFAYKDNYRHSSWISMTSCRINCSMPLLSTDSVFFCSIDDNEASNIKNILDYSFGPDNFESQIIIQSNKRGQTYQPIAKTHEYLFCYRASESSEIFELPKEISKSATQDNVGPYELWELRNRNPKFGKHNRPNLYYPIFVNENTLDKEGYASISLYCEEEHSIEVFPKNSTGVSSCWRWGKEKVSNSIKNGSKSTLIAKRKRDGGWNIYEKSRKSSTKAKSIWSDTDVINEQGTIEVGSFGFSEFGFPKPTGLIKKALQIGAKPDGVILDYFAGSGTTAHAAINMNREDDGERKFILIEMGEYFDTVLKPRIKKVIYSEEWKNGKPKSRQTSISQCCKYQRLESYEDALNNLDFKRTSTQVSLLADTSPLKEEYMLSYMMDLETEGSASLLNVDDFTDPWNYTLKIATGSTGETKTRPVDLVETFNYLLGLTVIRHDVIRSIEMVEGTNPEGEKILVIWRNTTEVSNVQLDEFFRKQEFNPRDTEFDLIYVNGDNNLENLKRADETWKVRLTEEEFKRLMFDVEDL